MPIHYETIEDHIVLITIDRPERKNALDLPHWRDLTDSWKRFRDEDDARVAIITGVKDCFCAGADLKGFINKAIEAANGKPIDLNNMDHMEIDGIPFTVTMDRHPAYLADLQADHLCGGRAMCRRRHRDGRRHRHRRGVGGCRVRCYRGQARPVPRWRHDSPAASPDSLARCHGAPADRGHDPRRTGAKLGSSTMSSRKTGSSNGRLNSRGVWPPMGRSLCGQSKRPRCGRCGRGARKRRTRSSRNACSRWPTVPTPWKVRSPSPRSALRCGPGADAAAGCTSS